jgi:hypothetical protein
MTRRRQIKIAPKRFKSFFKLGVLSVLAVKLSWSLSINAADGVAGNHIFVKVRT